MKSYAQHSFLETLSAMGVAGKGMRISGAEAVVLALLSLREGARPDELAGIDAAISVARQKVKELRREEAPAIAYQKVRMG